MSVDFSRDKEICCVCGRSVAMGSGLFCNRVPDCNGYEGRMLIGRQFPEGGWVCIICDNTNSDDEISNIDDILFSIKLEKDIQFLIRKYCNDN